MAVGKRNQFPTLPERVASVSMLVRYRTEADAAACYLVMCGLRARKPTKGLRVSAAD
jgi:hypothetical protein